MFGPKNPAIDTHHSIINIDEHISQKSEDKHNINEKHGGDNSVG
jgi:hypothetical protein